MAEYCGECAHLDWKNKESYTSRDRYYCNKRGRYVELTETSCYDFIKDPQKGKSASGSYTPSGCYITTMVCEVFGFEDNCLLLVTLRNFRDNVLKQDEKYIPLLIEYDTIGPIICNAIRNNPNKSILCNDMFNYFLVPCANNILTGNNEEAINIYVNMVQELKERLEIPEVEIQKNKKPDLENLGKGRIRKPQASEN